MKKQDFSSKKMPENCRLSFHPNFILAFWTSILTMKIYAFWLYGLASKNISKNASLNEFTAGRGHFELLRHPFWEVFPIQKRE